ncbi:MAG: hypothetical protein J6Y02_15110 [Pseudobutyrivibrio sp.]|nr:hypothetical protein [Pseudobutyrivibrio sp.]
MNTTFILQLIGIVLGSNVLFEMIKWAVERVDEKKTSPERIMLRALGEDRLGVLLRDWLHSDVRLADDWRIIENLYEGYTALNGNGEIKKLFLEASELKTTE